jgi:lipopolysaccharide biosynthesis glycosyltransferase
LKIDKIVIACFKRDLFLLRSCVASIRYWYPQISIELLKDSIRGEFSTREIEEAWNVGVFPSARATFGWPWSKLEVLLARKKERVLFLDSDTVFLGYVLDALAQYNQDFVVTGIRDTDPVSANVNSHYIDMKMMQEFDPAYRYPGFAFNGGQIVMTSGMLSEKDLEQVIDIGATIQNRFPEMLKHGDQGALNYVFAKAAADGKISLAYADFWIWPGLPETSRIDLASIAQKKGYPFVLHWAGIKPVDHRKYSRADIQEFFTDYYYSRVQRAGVRRRYREILMRIVTTLKIAKYRVLGWDYSR